MKSTTHPLRAGLWALILLSSCASEPRDRPAPAATPTPAAAPSDPPLAGATPTPTPVDPAVALEEAGALAATGRASYKDFLRALRAKAGESETRAKARQAKLDLQGSLDAYNEALDPLRDDEGLLPREYEGHEAAVQQTATFLVDLEKLTR